MQRIIIWMSHQPALPCMCLTFFDSCLLTTWRGQGCYCCFFQWGFSFANIPRRGQRLQQWHHSNQRIWTFLCVFLVSQVNWAVKYSHSHICTIHHLWSVVLIDLAAVININSISKSKGQISRTLKTFIYFGVICMMMTVVSPCPKIMFLFIISDRSNEPMTRT